MNKKAIKISVVLTNIFLGLLLFCAVALPFAVTWYVEKMGRDPKLPAIIMVVCYPCVPCAAAILLYLKRLMRNISQDMLFHIDSVSCFSRISTFCVCIAVITAVGGSFYLPFFIVGAAFAFFGLLVFVFKTVFSHIADVIDGTPKAPALNDQTDNIDE